MKPKRVKSPNQHLLAVRLPLPLVKRVNAARINQGLEWSQLMSNLFERYLSESANANAQMIDHIDKNILGLKK